MIKEVLNKNKGADSIVKFFKSDSGRWYMVGYGGMGNMSVLDVDEKEFKELDDELEKGHLVFVKSFFVPEIGGNGEMYYYQGGSS